MLLLLYAAPPQTPSIVRTFKQFKITVYSSIFLAVWILTYYPYIHPGIRLQTMFFSIEDLYFSQRLF